MTNYGYNIRSTRGGGAAYPVDEYDHGQPRVPNSYPLFNSGSSTGSYPLENFSHSGAHQGPVLPSPERTFSPAVAANYQRQKQEAFKQAVFASLAPAGGPEGEAALAALHADPVYRQKLAALYHSTSTAYGGQSKNIQGKVEGMQNEYDNAPVGPEGDALRNKLLPQIGAGIQNVADNSETIKNLEARGAQFVPGRDSTGNKTNPDLSFSNYPRAYPVAGQEPAFNPGTPQPADGAPGSGIAIQNQRAQQTSNAARTAQIESKLDTAGVGRGPVTLADERAAKAAYPYDPAIERVQIDRQGKLDLQDKQNQGQLDVINAKQTGANESKSRDIQLKRIQTNVELAHKMMLKTASGKDPAAKAKAEQEYFAAKKEFDDFVKPQQRTQGPPAPTTQPAAAGAQGDFAPNPDGTFSHPQYPGVRYQRVNGGWQKVE